MLKSLSTTALLLGLSVGAGHATTLSFDIPGSSGAGNAGLGSPGSYGDNVSSASDANGDYLIGAEGATPDVTVDYLGAQPLVWGTGYSTLSNVLYVEPDGTGFFGIQFTAAAGKSVTLSSFDLGNYGPQITGLDITVTAQGQPPAFSLLNYSLGSSSEAPTTLTPNVTGQVVTLNIDMTNINTSGFTDNIGIDNVVFSQADVTSTPAVPLPAGLPFLLAGLGAFALVRRKS